MTPTLTRLLAPALLSACVVAPGAANALTINLSGSNYEIYTATGTLADFQTLLEATPWYVNATDFGDFSIAQEAAGLVSDSLGLPNGTFGSNDSPLTNGPLFVTGVFDVNEGTGGFTGSEGVLYSLYAGPASNFFTPNQVSDGGTTAGAGALDFLTFTYAFARPVQVPGPLPLLGVAAAFGWSRKLRKRLKTST